MKYKNVFVGGRYLIKNTDDIDTLHGFSVGDVVEVLREMSDESFLVRRGYYLTGWAYARNLKKCSRKEE